MMNVPEKETLKDIIVGEPNGFNEVLEELTNATRRANFGDCTQVNSYDPNRKGLIDVKDFFQEFVTLEDFKGLTKEELTAYMDMEVDQYEHDNSYNYGGYFSNDIDFMTISFKDMEEDKQLLLVRFHVGLDIRAGYTDVLAIELDNYQNFNNFYGLTAPLVGGSAGVATVSYEENGDTHHIGIDVDGFNEYARAYDHGTNLDNEFAIDIGDRDDLTEAIQEWFKEENRECTITAIEYYNELNMCL